MSLGESMSSHAFEVRCARCNVTFPVETKRCVHCGGSTGPGHGISMRNTAFGTREAGDHSADVGPFDTTYGMDDEGIVFRDEAGASSTVPNAADRAEDADSSPVKSLIRSMGGVIWILLLIGFSLARSCGGE